jgi:VCBS repeat-containing protein/YVTN family beta-propeller protein
MESVWIPLLGSGPASPVQSPVSWVMLAAARRELDAPQVVKAPAATVSTGQPVAPAATTVAVPGAAATNSAPVIASVTLGAPNATTGAVTGTVKASDPNGDRMTYKATVASAAKGAVTITTAGVFTYSPTATARHAAAKVGATTAVTTDTVTVTVTDAKGAAVTRAVAVPISPKNSVPTATKTVGTPNATTGVVTGKVTATDADKDPVAYSVPATTAKGTVAITTAGAFTYTPTAAARHAAARIGATTADKADTFNVTVTDGYGGRLAVPVTVTISPRNTAPTATVSIAKPDPVTGIAKGKVTATDADKDTLSYTATKPANGTVAVNSDGSFAYTPTATARASARTSTTARTDTFTVTVADGHGGSAAVKVTATIAPSNSAPVAGTPTATTNTTTGVVTGTINATDPDKDTLTYTATTTTTSKGSASITSTGAYTYTPTATARHAAARTGAATAVTTDSFTATVTDKYGATTAIPVNVTIAPANAAPVAGTSTVGTPNATTGVVTGTVTATDADKDALSFSAPATTAKGAVAINAGTGAFTYTPTASARHAAARVGAVAADKADTFTVTATDGYGGLVAIPVSVTVTPVNAVPVAGTKTVGTPNASTGVVTGTATATDADKDTLTYSTPATTTKGAVTINASTGAFTYTPTASARHAAARITAGAADKSATFTITAADGYGGSVTIPVSVAIAPTNSAPVATAPVVFGPDITTGMVTGTVSATDADKDMLTYSVPAATAKGSVVINSDGDFTYTPTRTARQQANTTTTDTFTVTVTDNHGGSAHETITVPVDPGTPVPGLANTDAPSSNGAVFGSANFTDTAGRTLTYSTTPTSIGGGSVTINTATGDFVYIPTQAQRQIAGANTTDTITVIASNGVRSTTQAVTVPVDPGTPIPPEFATIGTPEITTGVVKGILKFNDTAGRAITYTVSKSGEPNDPRQLSLTTVGGGTVTINPTSGTFTYVPTQAQRKAVQSYTLDSFLIHASNGVNTMGAWVSVEVDPGTPIAGKPTIGAPNSMTGALAGQVKFTDTAGRTLTYSSPSTSVGGGAVTINPTTGAFTYTPTQALRHGATAITTDTITVVADNGARETVGVVYVPVDPGTPIAATPLVNPPDANNGLVTGTAMFSDTAGRALTYSASTATNGSISIDKSTGDFTYTPTELARLKSGMGAGPTSDTFTVTANNGVRNTSQTVNVQIATLRNIPTAPAMRGTFTVNPTTGSLTGKLASSDPAGFPLTYSLEGAPTNGAVTVNSDGTIIYTPNPIARVRAATGTGPTTDSFTVTATNGRYASAAGTVSVPITSPAPNTVIATIEVTSAASRADLRDLALSPDGSRLFVTHASSTGGAEISVINTATNLVSSRIQLGGTDGGDLVISPNGSRLSVFNSGRISTIDTVTNKIISTATFNSGAADSVLTPDGSRIYTTSNRTTVSVIDTATNTVSQTITATTEGRSLRGLAISPDGSRLYATDGKQNVTVINTATNTVTASVEIPLTRMAEVLYAAVSPDGNRVYVTADFGKVAVIDAATNTVIKTIPVSSNTSEKIVISPDGSRLYVVSGCAEPGNCAYGKVSVVDTATDTVTATIPVGASPNNLEISADGHLLYVSNSNRFPGVISVIYT